MKFLTYIKDSKEYAAVLSKDEKYVFPLIENGFNHQNMNEVINNMTEEEKTKLNEFILSEKGTKYPLNTVKLAAPIPRPAQDIICLGMNYYAHVEEGIRYSKTDFGGDRKFPIYFSKRVNLASGDGDIIPAHEDIIKTLDYEAELAVIIGKEAKNVKPEEVSKYIFGYTIVNDITARELQSKHKQWYFGKSLDGFTPMGPYIITADEISYPPVMRIRSYVNGELRQESTTDLFIHDIDYVVSELTQGMTLLPGTIISTGTPAGAGMGFNPPMFLKKGDKVTCEIEGIGKITNEVK